MSNARKLRRQLQKSPYVQKMIRNHIKQNLEQKAKDRILLGEEQISLFIYEQMQNTFRASQPNSDAKNTTGSPET